LVRPNELSEGDELEMNDRIKSEKFEIKLTNQKLRKLSEQEDLKKRSEEKHDNKLKPEKKPGLVVSVNLSRTKSVRKKPGQVGVVVEDSGFKGDAHSGPGLRQVSLLALESIEKMRRVGLEVGPGDFAENLTTSGLNLSELPIGTILEIGREVVLEVTQIGKTCHTKCAIFRQVGQCVMPEEGIFARVVKGGKIMVGDEIHVREKT